MQDPEHATRTAPIVIDIDDQPDYDGNDGQRFLSPRVKSGSTGGGAGLGSYLGSTPTYQSEPTVADHSAAHSDRSELTGDACTGV